MAFENENGGTGMYMPVAPAYNGGNNGGFFGGDWAWIILLLLIGGGGWGGFGGFGGGMMWPLMMGGMAGGWDLYPWLNNSQHISDGFRDQMLNTSVNSIGDKITSGFGDVATQLCGGFAGVNASINGAQNALAQQLYTNQIADLERSFAAQTASTAGFTGVNSGIADLRYTVATEACADRAAVGDALQAVTMQGVQNTNALMTTLRDGIQSIKDELCNDRLDAERRDNANLRQQLAMADLRASQTAQNAFISQGFANEVDALYNRLSQCPVNTVPVAGNTPLFACNPSFNSGNGCGCGYGNGFAN